MNRFSYLPFAGTNSGNSAEADADAPALSASAPTRQSPTILIRVMSVSYRNGIRRPPVSGDHIATPRRNPTRRGLRGRPPTDPQLEISRKMRENTGAGDRSTRRGREK